MTSKVGAPSLDETLDNPMQIRMIMAICRSRTVLIKNNSGTIASKDNYYICGIEYCSDEKITNLYRGLVLFGNNAPVHRSVPRL